MSIMTQIRDVDHAISALDGWLRERDYTLHCREGIAVHIRANGEVAGCVPEYLDREDLETATGVFCEALPAVPQTSRDWDVAGYQTPSDARPLLSTVQIGPADILPADDDQPTDTASPDRDRNNARKLSLVSAWEQGQVEMTLPSISGGAPDPKPFEPTPADLAEDASWSAGLDDAMSIPKTVPGPRWPNRDNVESYERIARIASTGNID